MVWGEVVWRVEFCYSNPYPDSTEWLEVSWQTASLHNRLILSKFNIKPRILGLFSRKPVLVLLTIAIIFSPILLVLPLAKANTTPYSNPGVVLNSQTIPLVDTFGTGSQLPFRGGGDITILDGSALMPESPLSLLATDESEIVAGKGDIAIYVVRDGDSLSGIAQMFDVSVNTIVWANDIHRATAIYEGQVLVILPVSGVKYEVKKGDTLASLAKRYHGDLEEIAKFNDLDPNGALALGTEIIIPDGEMVAVEGSKGEVPLYVDYYLRPVRIGKKTQGIHGYNGVDLGAPTGTSVLASAAGTVMVSRSGGWNGGYGNFIVIKHGNGTQTLYAHNSQNLVKVGAKVVQGQVIGYVGSTGKSTGPHLHFEVRGAKNPF